MKKGVKISLLLNLFLIIYISSIFIFNTFVKDQEWIDLFGNFTFIIILISIFSFFGYLIIKTKKYTTSQKIFLIVFLIIIGFIDIILLFIGMVSGLWIFYPILGIFNSISLGIFAMSLGIIESKIFKI